MAPRIKVSAVSLGLVSVFLLASASPLAFGSTFGDKAGWITDASNTLLTQMPRVDAFMWFNNYKPGMTEPDWRIVPDAPQSPNPTVITAYNNAWGNLSRGVFIDGNPDPSTTPAGMGKINHYESYVGHQDRVGWFESFASPFPLASVEAVAARGSRSYIVWQPYDDAAGYAARGNQSLLPLINGGQYDTAITAWATAAKATGSPMDISFGHEMNGNWFNWGYLPDNYYANGAPALTAADKNTPGHNGNSPQDFINAFQHVVSIFHSAGATNVNFVWDVNADFVDDYTVAYPGDDFVNRMGMNGFNWGQRVQDPNNVQYDDWRDLDKIFGPWWPGASSTYATLAGLSQNPIIVGEFGSNTPEPVTLAFLALGSLVLVRRRR